MLNTRHKLIVSIIALSIALSNYAVLANSERSSIDSTDRINQNNDVSMRAISDSSQQESAFELQEGQKKLPQPVETDPSAKVNQARPSDPLTTQKKEVFILWPLLKRFFNYANITMLIAILAILFGLFGVRYQVRKPMEKELKEKINQSFQELPWSIAPEEIQAKERHKANFYIGNCEHNPSTYVGLDLDAERQGISKIMKLINAKKPRDWIHISIWGSPKQGRTIFLARLAQNLTQQKKFRIFGRKYHILWCKEGMNTPFRRMAQKSDCIDLLVDYRKNLISRGFPFFRKKQLIVCIDDIHQPEILDPAEVIEISWVKSFLRQLMRQRISVITTSTSEDIAIEETTALFRLTLERPDAESLLAKLVQENVVSEELADTFLDSPEGELFYKKDLFSFYGSLLENTGRKPLFIAYFEKVVAELNEYDRKILETISICQLVGVGFPELLLKALFPNSSQQFQEKSKGILRKESIGRFFFYYVEGPYFAKWMLEEKLDIYDFDTLSTAYLRLFGKIITTEANYPEVQRIALICRIIKRMVYNWSPFVFKITGKSLALQLLNSIGPQIEQYLNACKNPGGMVLWASALKSSQMDAAAVIFYRKAAEQIKLPIMESVSHESLRTPISAAMGLSNASDRDAKELAVDLLQNIIEKLLSEQDEKWVWSLRRTAHKLADVLVDLDRPKDALKVINDISSHVSLDCLLLQIQGDILESLGRLAEAYNCLRRSVGENVTIQYEQETSIRLLQHYANFLINYQDIAEQHNENPEIYLKKAERLFTEEQEPDLYLAVLNAWAKYKKTCGEFAEMETLYKKCISFGKQKNFVHAHSLIEYAHFLISDQEYLPERKREERLAEAERLCWMVINEPKADETARRSCAHMVGRLIGGTESYTSLSDKLRPSYSEAVGILRKYSFESPEPERNDDNKKTYQDVITHKILGDVCGMWSMEKGVSRSQMERLIRESEFHYRGAFTGLPRPDLDSIRIRTHLLDVYVEYAEVLWKQKRDYDAAERYYKKAVKEYEEKNYKWEKAYTIYAYYAIFLFETQMDDNLVLIAELNRQALNLLPQNWSKRRAAISNRLGHSLHSIFIKNFDFFEINETESRMEEIIERFEETLSITPEDMAAASELSHFYAVPGHGIIPELCTKERIMRVQKILWRTWEKCPTNTKALNGLLDVVDYVIDRHLNDSDAVDEVYKIMNSHTILNKEMRDIINSVCLERINGGSSGKLTKLLCKT